MTDSSSGMGERRLMTAGEVSEYLRISRASVYRLVKMEKIPVSKIGRQLRFRQDTIDEWLSRKEMLNNNKA